MNHPRLVEPERRLEPRIRHQRRYPVRCQDRHVARVVAVYPLDRFVVAPGPDIVRIHRRSMSG